MSPTKSCCPRNTDFFCNEHECADGWTSFLWNVAGKSRCLASEKGFCKSIYRIHIYFRYIFHFVSYGCDSKWSTPKIDEKEVVVLALLDDRSETGCFCTEEVRLYIHGLFGGGFTLSPIIMEVENCCIWKVSTIGGTHFSLPWIWEEG